VLTDNETGADLTCDGILKYTAYFINLGSEPVHVTATLEVSGELQINEVAVELTVGPNQLAWTVPVHAISANAAQTVIARLGVEASGLELHVEGSEPTVLPPCEPPADGDRDAGAAPPAAQAVLKIPAVEPSSARSGRRVRVRKAAVAKVWSRR